MSRIHNTLDMNTHVSMSQCQISALNATPAKHLLTRLELNKSVRLRNLGSVFTYFFFIFNLYKEKQNVGNITIFARRATNFE